MNDSLKENLYKIIGNKIRAQREKAHFTQNELGERLNLSRTSIVNIEQGRQHPYIHILWDITEIFVIDLSELLPNKEDIINGISFDRTLIKQSLIKKEDIQKFDTFLDKI